MKKILSSFGLAVLTFACLSHAEPVGYVTQFSGVPIVSGTTNNYAPVGYGTSGTNIYLPYGNTFIGTSEFTNFGLTLTCTNSWGSNVVGNVVVRLAPCWDTIENTFSASQSISFSCPITTITNSPGTVTGYEVSSVGLAGYWITSVELTNVISGGVPTAGITNFLTMGIFRGATKHGTFPASIYQ